MAAPKVKRKIYFYDFAFRPGLNMTIRRGVEWDIRPTGKYLALHPVHSGLKLPIYVSHTQVFKFMDIPEALLGYHHAGTADRGQIALSLRRIYPQFWPEEIVTLVFFRLEGQDNEAK